jgi:hypothetical protein
MKTFIFACSAALVLGDLPAPNCVTLSGVGVCVEADGASSKGSGTSAACNDFATDSVECATALVSSEPQCPRYTCGGATNIGEAAFSLHNPVYDSAGVPAQAANAGNGAIYTFEQSVTVTGVTIEQHSYGCTGVEGFMDGVSMGTANHVGALSPEGVDIAFTFPSPQEGTVFRWVCTSTVHSSAYAIYRAIPSFTATPTTTTAAAPTTTTATPTTSTTTSTAMHPMDVCAAMTNAECAADADCELDAEAGCVSVKGTEVAASVFTSSHLLPDWVYDLPHSCTYDAGSVGTAPSTTCTYGDCTDCSAEVIASAEYDAVLADLNNDDYTSTNMAGWHDANGWTPWLSDNDSGGFGDVESFQSLNEKHNLCGTPNLNVDETDSRVDYDTMRGEAIDAECATLDGTSADTLGQTVTCGISGFECRNADNEQCWGSDPECAAANLESGVAYTHTQSGEEETVSKQESACRDASVDGKNCIWGCANYKIRFRCSEHYTAAPTTSPTPSPTFVPTTSPTMSPTMSPTFAPSPRGFNHTDPGHDNGGAGGHDDTVHQAGGLAAAPDIDFVPALNVVPNTGFTSDISWRPNLETTILTYHDDAGAHSLEVSSYCDPAGDAACVSPGVYTYLMDEVTFEEDTRYLLLVRGTGSATQWSEGWSAKPFVKCEIDGVADQFLPFSTGALSGVALPPEAGVSINMFTPASDATNCRAGVLFHTPKSSSTMTLERFEIRPMQDYESGQWDADVDANALGMVANAQFGHGSQFWHPIKAATNNMDEVWSNGKHLVVWNHGQPAGEHNGVEQTGLILPHNANQTITVRGYLARNGAQNGNARVFVQKKVQTDSGPVFTDLTDSADLNNRLSTSGMTDTTVDFHTTVTETEVENAVSVTFSVGVRFEGNAPADVEIFLQGIEVHNNTNSAWKWWDETAKLEKEAELDALRVARDPQPCNCDPRIHSSKATKCFSQSSAHESRRNVVKVVHRKSMQKPTTFEDIGMDQADQHVCNVVDGHCKCCDCLDGQIHGFDMDTLKDGRKFTVRFSENFNDAADTVKAGMTGTCRYVAGEWCCACTNSWLGKSGASSAHQCLSGGMQYGDESCHAYDGAHVGLAGRDGINFWGKNFHFKEYHRCVVPEVHHTCGEFVNPDPDLAQDIGHLPYFDNNDRESWDGFTIVNNANTLADQLSDYTEHDGWTSICPRARDDQMGGLQNRHTLSRDDCAVLCNHNANCAGFTFIPAGVAYPKDSCQFRQAAASQGEAISCTVEQAGVTYYSKNAADEEI